VQASPKWARFFAMSPGRRELLILGAVGAVAALAGGVVAALGLQSRSGAAELLSSGYPDLSGKVWRLAEWRGRPLVCNFWATWCEPCREEIPLLHAVHLKYAVNSLQIVGIAVDNADNVRKYLQAVQVAYPMLVADASAIDLMRRAGNTSGGLPFTVMLDAAGRLRERRLGAYTAAQLEREIVGLLR
jgi:thiol-disulfide isomerase/thioredoxin